jgi:hypothetical protein
MLRVQLKETKMSNVYKQSPVIEDLRSHTSEQLMELRLLLKAGITGRPDERRPGFFEIDGVENVYYIFRYPHGCKVLLLAAWMRKSDPVAAMVACASEAV